MRTKFPGNHDRLAVIGRTGSGKTQAAAWHLSGKDFDRQPWVIVNTKGDPLLNEISDIEGVKSISLNEQVGEKGLYIVSPLPSERDQLDTFFRSLWEKQNVGVYIDEGYMIDKTDGLNALLTQGRSRKIPMIVLSQRPAWISKFVFSEADFIQLFHLQHEADRKNVAQFVPFDTRIRLPRYHSYWYNVADNEIIKFGPVPPRDVILQNFRDAFPPDPSQVPEEVAYDDGNIILVRRRVVV